VDTLRRAGRVRDVDGSRCVVFDDDRCPGCKGRCGVSIGRSERVACNLPVGTRIVVATPADSVLRRAGLVFGVPLLVVVGAAILAERLGWGGWSEAVAVLASLLVGCAAAAIARRSDSPRGESVGPRLESADPCP